MPSDLPVLKLLHDAELRCEAVGWLGHLEHLLGDECNALEAEKLVVDNGIPGIHMLVPFACTPPSSKAYTPRLSNALKSSVDMLMMLVNAVQSQAQAHTLSHT